MKAPFLLSFLFSVAVVSAQKWCAPGAEWTYNFYGWGTEGYVRVNLAADTTINGQQCKKLVVRNKIKQGYPIISIDSSYRTPVFTFSRNDTVFIYRQGSDSFVATYFFNVVVGDTIKYLNTSNMCNSPIISIVDSIGSRTISNQSLKYYVAHVLHPQQSILYPDRITIVERLGCLETYIEPTFVCVTDAESFTLRCYKDDSIISYQTDPLIACDYFYTSIDEISNPVHFTAYPNPTHSEIALDNDVTIQFYIIDPLGRQLRKGIVQPHQSINLDSLQQGIYFLSLLGNDGLQTTSFIKEN
jgi:hypothetical protein